LQAQFLLKSKDFSLQAPCSRPIHALMRLVALHSSAPRSNKLAAAHRRCDAAARRLEATTDVLLLRSFAAVDSCIAAHNPARRRHPVVTPCNTTAVALRGHHETLPLATKPPPRVLRHAQGTQIATRCCVAPYKHAKFALPTRFPGLHQTQIATRRRCQYTSASSCCARAPRALK
jgi:hypothetical protein